MSEAVPRVVIVGGGFGGLAAAKALRKSNVDVVLIDRQNHHLFQPLLYQVATSVLGPGQIASPIRGILRKQRNTTVILGECRGGKASTREARRRSAARSRRGPYRRRWRERGRRAHRQQDRDLDGGRGALPGGQVAPGGDGSRRPRPRATGPDRRRSSGDLRRRRHRVARSGRSSSPRRRAGR